MGCGSGGYGGSGVNRYYGVFCDTTTQTASLTTAAYAMKFNTTEIADGVSIVSGSRITVANTGIYNVQFSAQLDKASGSPADIDIWINYTGSNVARSNTRLTVNGSNAKHVPAWNYVLPIVASDYIELMWRTSNVDLQIVNLPSASNPTRPEIPSIILTVQQV
jgi:hypothetical protein